jgi:hypothetical protein
MQRFALFGEEAAGYAALMVAVKCDALTALTVARAAFYGAGALFYVCTGHGKSPFYESMKERELLFLTS